MSSIILGQTFQSQSEFDQALQKYCDQQCVPYVVFSSKSSERFNAEQLAKGGNEMPKDIKWKQATISCKHYGKPREHNHVPGKEMRPNQSTFKQFCKAKFNLNYDLRIKSLVVTKLVEDHSNHPTESHLKQHYPEFRRPSKETVEKVHELLNNEVRAHLIRKVVHSTGIKATKQDLQNLRNKWKATILGTDTPTEAVLKELSMLKEQDPDSIAALNYNETSKEIESIFFQTSDMRKDFALYADILVIDTTYKLCDNNMPLIVFEVVDCYGAGRVVGYALLSSEKKEVVTEAVGIFKIGCEEVIPNIKIVMVDKDQSEIASVREVMPNAEIHLCDFHVKDAMQTAGRKMLSNWDEIEVITKRLIHAHSRQEYENAYVDLNNAEEHIKPEFLKNRPTHKPVSNRPFLDYFNKNWHTLDLVWSDYQRNCSFNLGLRTTGILESHNATIKRVITKKLPPAMVIRRLRTLRKDNCFDNAHKDFLAAAKSRYHKYSKDPIIQEIMKVNTPIVADIIKRQYERSLEPPSMNQHDVSGNNCDCKFFTNHKLPCSHIFRERRRQGLPIYDHALVPVRWTVIITPSEGNGMEKNRPTFSVVASTLKVPKNHKPKTMEDRYNDALRVCERICSLVADCGGKQYAKRLNALLSMEEMFRMGKEVAIVGLNGSGQPDTEIIQVEGSTSNEEEEQVEGNCQVSQNPGSANQPETGAFASETLHASKTQNAIGTQNVSETQNSAFHEFTGNSKVGEDCEENLRGPLQIRSGTVVDFSRVNSDLLKILKLPPNPIVKGRPKGKRKIKAAKKSVVSDEDEDDVQPVNEQSQCPSCLGSLIRRTSFTKKNYQRKYFACASPKNEKCPHFISWDTADQASSVKGIASSECTVKRELEVIHEVECVDLTLHDDEDMDVMLQDEDMRDTLISPSSTPHRDELQDERDSFISPTSTPDRNPPQNPTNDESLLVNVSSPCNISATTTKMCYACGEEAVMRTSTKSRSYGQKFYTCPSKSTEKCLKINWLPWVRSEKVTKSQNTIPILLTTQVTAQANAVNGRRMDVSQSSGKENEPPETSSLHSVSHGLGGDTLEIPLDLDDVFLREISRLEGNALGISITNYDENPCVICKEQGPPSEEGGHKCYSCGTPVHAFGCSKSLGNGEEGFGGNDRVCLQCYNTRDKSNSVRKQTMSSSLLPQNSASTFESTGNSKLRDDGLRSKNRNVSNSIHQDKCDVCKKLLHNIDCATCSQCKKKCHVNTTCSKPDHFTLKDGVAPLEKIRICNSCICEHCKLPNKPPHTCVCAVCKEPTYDLEKCSNCWQPIHKFSCSSIFDSSTLCHNCILSKESGINKSDFDILISNQMLSDTIITSAMEMLKRQFPYIGGLARPISSEDVLIRFPDIGYEHNSYVASAYKEMYIQILHSGYDHWLTCYKPRNSSRKIHILNTSGACEIGSFVEQQLALIMNIQEEDGSDFTVTYSQVKSQEGGVNECGPLAIAIAVDIAFTNQLLFIDFDLNKLRNHLLMCMVKKKLEPFPRKVSGPSRTLKTQSVYVYCTCRLPGHYDTQLTICSKCRIWCHSKCHKLIDKPKARRWMCDVCINK